MSSSFFAIGAFLAFLPAFFAYLVFAIASTTPKEGYMRTKAIFYDIWAETAARKGSFAKYRLEDITAGFIEGQLLPLSDKTFSLYMTITYIWL